jgi:hypothetical protein
MTRRARGKGRVLSLDAYIHHATLGLPREERLDAAAELRTHLLARVAEHEAQGFSREEAEYLAVRGMGEPRTVDRGLLGHVFTHRLGWATLAVLILGGAGWSAWREWLPPREGLRLEAASPQDIAFLFTLKDAPRGTYQAATLTYPRGTRAVAYVTVASSEDRYQPANISLFTKDVTGEEAQNFVGRPPGSYRYQERWLLTTWPMTCHGQERAGIYTTGQVLASPFWNSGTTVQRGPGGQITGDCNNPSVRLHTVQEALASVPPTVAGRTVPAFGNDEVATTGNTLQPLTVDQWTVIKRLGVDPAADTNSFGSGPVGGYSAQARGVYVAVMPLRRSVSGSRGYSYGAGMVQIDGDPDPLPPLPPLVP